MWCLTKANGSRSFHPTEQAAEAAAGAREHVVWFDSFDYEQHNPGHAAQRYADRVQQERAAGTNYVHTLCASLRQRLGLETPTA